MLNLNQTIAHTQKYPEHLRQKRNLQCQIRNNYGNRQTWQKIQPPINHIVIINIIHLLLEFLLRVMLLRNIFGLIRLFHVMQAVVVAKVEVLVGGVGNGDFVNAARAVG